MRHSALLKGCGEVLYNESMNIQLKDFFARVSKKERLIIGLMSGTSLDGLDIALCRFKGNGNDMQMDLLNFHTETYEEAFRDKVKDVFSKDQVSLEKVCLMNELIAHAHAAIVNSTLNQWGLLPTDIDFIASHGQTIYHAPKSLHGLEAYPNGTLQIGDGDHLAVLTGIITLSDFRQKHIAAGGEGAPLAVYGDYLLFRKPGEDRILLNIGGIANFTYLPGNGDFGALFSSDVGPGNTLMDRFIQKYFPGQHYDKDAAVARRGTPNQSLLTVLLEHPFFDAPFPKTTGPELFSESYVQNALHKSGQLSISVEDLMATLAHFTAEGIVRSIEKTTGNSAGTQVIMSGGGMHNPLVRALLKERLSSVEFTSTATYGVDPDAKEAVLFALLANETLNGEVQHFGVRKGVPAVSMGKISLPR